MMTLFWPKQQVALQIVDDPGEGPFGGADESWTVFRMMDSDLDDYECFKKTMASVSAARARAAECPRGGSGGAGEGEKSAGHAVCGMTHPAGPADAHLSDTV